MTLQDESIQQFEQTPPKYVTSKPHTRRFLQSTNKPIYSHYSSTECISGNIPKKNPNMDSNISSSILSSIISSSTTSGFVSASNSTTNSISSSKSNDFLNPQEFNNEIKSGSVSSTRMIYENMMDTKSKNRISNFQPERGPKTPKSPNVKKFGDNGENAFNSQYIIDPISSSSRHPSTNSTKCLNHVIITPRNSTSTVNNSRRESNNTLETQTSRRSSQMNKSKHSNNNRSFDDLEDDLDVNDYDEDDDIFDFKESSNDNLNIKQYHNSISTASCIESEINCLNTYNITPDTSSSSASSSSFSAKIPTSPKQKNFKNTQPSTPELSRGPKVATNRQFKLSSQNTPLPPLLPTTTKSFFVHNSTDFSIQDSLQNFSHFDVQSVYFSFKNVKSIISSIHVSMNIKTGASAASKLANFENLNRTLPPIPHVLVSKRIRDEDKKPRLSTSMYDSTLPPISPRTKDEKPSFNLSIDSDLDSKLNELVEECPCFKLEVGGDSFKGLGLVHDVSQRRMMKLNSINILDKINLNYKKEIIDLIEQNNNEPFTIEYQDIGAYFYRYFFLGHEHANYLGTDEHLGPIAISIRRDKLITEPNNRLISTNFNSGNERVNDYAYRFILRTTDLNSLRGTILEEHISNRVSGSKGLPHKEVIKFLMPDINLDCLRLADTKIAEKLIGVDEQYIIKNHKIGVLLCKAGQSTEEEMYNNRDSTPAFDEFLQLLGDKVFLKGFSNYLGGLDHLNDTSGTHSVHTKFRNNELMFHVSTLLPFSTNDKQQLTRKRHIGNDLVTIIFQEPGSLPFSPKTIRSQYQHIFIVVRAINPNSFNTQYSVAISYSKDIPSFGPALPKNPLFFKSKEFREFLLAKIINADNVGLKCEKFTQIRMRARNGALKDMIDLYSTKFTLENCANGAANSNIISQKLGLLNFGSIKQKKLRSKSCQAFNASMTSEDEINSNRLSKLNGSILWNLESVEDFQYIIRNCCVLGISKQNIVIVDLQQKCVLLSIGCNAVIGWSVSDIEYSLILYFDLGECVNIKLKNKADMYAVIKRLEYFTKGCKTIELCVEKKDCGLLGFNIHHDGVVTEVEQHSLAHYRGLRQGARIVKIGDNFVINLSHEKMIDLLRNSMYLKLTFLQPFDDGSARRGQDDSFSLYSYLSTCSSINERQIDSIKNTPMLTSYSKSIQSTFSPQRNRRMTTSEHIAKLIHRLSTSGSINENEDKNNSIFTNSLYYGIDDASKKEIELTSIQSPKKLPNKNISDWQKMVQTASKNFENVQRSTDNGYFNENLTKNRLNSTSSSHSKISKEEKKRPPNLDLKECIEQNLEKTASYDELKDRLLFLQLELNKEKQEKKQIKRQEAQIREEYINLQQEYLRVKEQLRVTTPTTPTSRKYSNKNDFIDCSSDMKPRQNATAQVLRLNEIFFPNHTYAYSNDSHV